MSPGSQVALVGFLVAVLLAVLALLAWQQAQRRAVAAPVVYGVEDAVAFVVARLERPVAERLRTDGVRRILEWEVFYLQGLAQPDRHRPVETVAGGAAEAVSYIADRIAARHGVTYSPADIAEVLRLEAEYLVSIGAVGEPVDPGVAPGGRPPRAGGAPDARGTEQDEGGG